MSEKESQPSRDKEIQLILGCAQTVIPSETADEVSRLLTQPLDWEYTLITASRNGLLPLLSWNLLRKFRQSLPGEIQERLSAFYQSHMQENLFLSFKLTEVVSLLEKNEIPVLSLKGPTLAVQAYGDPALRHYVDLDILVQPRHFDRAIELLLCNGYKSDISSGPLKRKLLFFTRKKDLSLFSSDNRVRVELHWKLSGSHFSLPLELDQLWNRMDSLNMGGTDLRVLAFNDLFVYLCLHGARHGWERLAWICDLNELIRRREAANGPIAWAEVRQHAKNHGCEKVFALGLFLVRKFFGGCVGCPTFEESEDHEVYVEITDKVYVDAFASRPNSSQIGDWYMFHLSLKERSYDKLKLKAVYLVWYLKLIFTPNAVDKSIFRLPVVLYPLYFVMRPLRLLINYFYSFDEK
ncbi:MAG: nucleotidyltransferase family protein [Pyrinomonadaceae bacterium]